MHDKHAQNRIANMRNHPAGKQIVEQKRDWTGFCLVLGGVTVLLAVCILAFGGKANADEPRKDIEPYGGCKEIYQVFDNPEIVHSKAARWCRHHGWVVTKRVTVDPFGQAVTDLPTCKQEDSTRCYWNALANGNKRGHGYIALPGRTIYVDGINGDWATSKKMRLGYWMVLPADV